MRVPSTSAPLLFFIDASKRYVRFNQFTYPALQVLSAVNRATELPVIQDTSAAQPVWNQSSLAGTYSGVNFPGYPGTSGFSAGAPGFGFAGSQYFKYDTLSTSLTGVSTSFTAVAAVSCNASGSASTIFGLGDASDGYFLALQYQSGNVFFEDSNVHGTYSASAAMNNSVHVVSCIKTATSLTLRIDGAVAATTALTTGAEAFSTFTVGALNSNGSVGSNFSGVIGKLLVYGGVADIVDVEKDLLLQSGVTQG